MDELNLSVASALITIAKIKLILYQLNLGHILDIIVLVKIKILTCNTVLAPTQRKFASETGYFEDTTKSDFWDKFVDFANSWNKIGIPNKWATLRVEDESKYTETLESSH